MATLNAVRQSSMALALLLIAGGIASRAQAEPDAVSIVRVEFDMWVSPVEEACPYEQVMGCSVAFRICWESDIPLYFFNEFASDCSAEGASSATAGYDSCVVRVPPSAQTRPPCGDVIDPSQIHLEVGSGLALWDSLGEPYIETDSQGSVGVLLLTTVNTSRPFAFRMRVEHVSSGSWVGTPDRSARAFVMGYVQGTSAPVILGSGYDSAAGFSVFGVEETETPDSYESSGTGSMSSDARVFAFATDLFTHDVDDSGRVDPDDVVALQDVIESTSSTWTDRFDYNDNGSIDAEDIAILNLIVKATGAGYFGDFDDDGDADCSDLTGSGDAFGLTTADAGYLIRMDYNLDGQVNDTDKLAFYKVIHRADFDLDGSVDFFDSDAFDIPFQLGDPEADWDLDGSTDFFDYDAFVFDFEYGC